ncbi:MAG: hypothetical protein PHS02_00175 [Candidatus ainarchaeum sp.]|nr:hypothetical protein [Candidatus ainarchaeum sp.]
MATQPFYAGDGGIDKTNSVPDWSQLPLNNLKFIGALNCHTAAVLEIKDGKYKDARTSITEGLKFVKEVLRNREEKNKQLLHEAKKLRRSFYLIYLSIPLRALAHKVANEAKDLKFRTQALYVRAKPRRKPDPTLELRKQEMIQTLGGMAAKLR